MRQGSRQYGSRLRAHIQILGAARIEGTRTEALAVVSEHAGQRNVLGERADDLRWSQAGLRLEIRR